MQHYFKMVSKFKPSLFSSVIASLIIVLRRSILLILTPYKTMRRISTETDYLQLFWIGLFILLYFLVVGFTKILTFIVMFVGTLTIMYVVGRVWKKAVKVSDIIFAFSYGLLPTTIWFYLSWALFYLLPPPRTPSVQGKIFSALYVSFSLSLLFWKLILTYLAIRFSLKLGFYSSMFILFFYVLCILTISYFAFTLGLAKVPFI